MAPVTKTLILSGLMAGWVSACDFGPGTRVDTQLLDGDRRIALSASRVDPALDRLDLKGLAQQVMECRQAEQWRVVKFGVYSSEEDRNRALAGAKSPSLGFAGWKRAYESEKPAPAVSALSYGPAAIVRRVDHGAVESGGAVKRADDLSGDALPPFELLDVAIADGAATEPDAAATPGFITFFVRASGSLAEASGVAPAWQSVAARLGSGLDSMWVQVKFRNDAWFIDDLSFPISYPFDAPRPATPAQPPAGPAVDCVTRQGKMGCRLVSAK